MIRLSHAWDLQNWPGSDREDLGLFSNCCTKTYTFKLLPGVDMANRAYMSIPVLRDLEEQYGEA